VVALERKGRPGLLASPDWARRSGNVLVAAHDGKLIPKVIDFGIAKALNGSPLDMTQVTEGSQVLGTLPYMSPEQAREGSPQRLGADIDTRTDIYSLGVVLYELLADVPPFDSARLQSMSSQDMRRVIREEDPPPPSQRLAALSRELPDADATRRTELRRRAQELGGEPDWIVLKAMEKDRDRRYATAESLAADVERYLHYEPVSAGPPTKLYRMRKFARRNRRSLLTAIVIVAAIAAGVASSLVSLVHARHSAAAEVLARRLADEQAARAAAGEKKAKEELEQVRDGQRAAFRLLDPEPGLPAGPYGNVLGFIASRLDAGRLHDYPLSEEPVRAALGRGYQALEQWPAAAAQFRRASELESVLRGPEALEVAVYSWEIGRCLMSDGQYDQAVPVLRKAMHVYEVSVFHIPQVGIRGDLAAVAAAKGDPAAAEAMLKEAGEQARLWSVPLSRCDPIDAFDDLAAKRAQAGDVSAAQALRRAAEEARQRRAKR
jgi:tetratricopeptide (TPR) repeat protein